MNARTRRAMLEDQSQGDWNQQSPFQDQQENPLARYSESTEGNRGTEAPTSQAYTQPDPNAGSGGAATGQLGQSYTGQSGYTPSALTQNLARRGAGGQAGRTIGAAAGTLLGTVVPGVGNVVGSMIGGALGGLVGGGRRAATAGTDVSVEDARRTISQAYQQLFGRVPSQAEVDTHLMNVGWRPGHRWVGDAGLSTILNNLPSGAQNADVGALAGPNAATTSTATGTTTATATTGTSATTNSGGATAGGAWGLSPSGQKVDFTGYQAPTYEGGYHPGQYRGLMEGFNPDKFDPSHPEAQSLKMIGARVFETIDPYAEDAVDQAIAKFQALGIKAEKAAFDKIYFPESGEVVDVLRNASYVEDPSTGTVAWAWMPDGPTSTYGAGSGASLGNSQSAIQDLLGGYNYETLLQELLGNALGKK